MKLERIEMVNWCGHKARTVNFHPRLTALLGANGSGKSNTIHGVLFALTGDTSMNDGVKALNVRCGAQTEPAYVRLTATHNSTRFVLKRALQGAKTSLELTTLDGQKLESVVGDTKVTARVMALLKTTPAILRNYVFVMQGAMFAPFDPRVPPAQRTAELQRLFGLARLEELWAALGERLSQLPEQAMPDVSGARNAVAQLRTQLQHLTTQLAPIQHLAQWDALQDPDTTLLAYAEQAASFAAAVQQAEQTRTDLHAPLREARKAVKQTQAHVDTMQSALQVLERQLGTLSQAQAQIAAFEAWRQAEQNRQSQLTALSIQQRELRHPGPDPECGTEAELTDHIAATTVDVARARELLSTFTSGVAVCPTCGTPTQALAALLEDARDRLPLAEAALAQLQQQLQARRAYDQAVRLFTQQSAALSERMAGLMTPIAQQLAGATVLTEATYGTVKQHVSDYVCIQSEQRAALAELRVHSNNLQYLRQRRHEARNTYRRAAQARAGVPDAAACEAARDRLRLKQQQATECTRLQVEQRVVTAGLHAAEQQLHQVEQVASAVQSRAQQRQLMQEIRDVLHRDRLPMAVMRAHLAGLAETANTLLAEFNQPFRLLLRVGTDNVLGYSARFCTGVEQPLARLSGGQQTMAALAFRSATNTRFASDLGIIGLDEPTAWLDKDNIACLGPALDYLRRTSDRCGLQCLLITHEQEMGALFDHVENFIQPDD